MVAGEALWWVAEHMLANLGDTPTYADVEHAWRAIYAANRAVIGSNPDMIRPGQVLHLPAAGQL